VVDFIQQLDQQRGHLQVQLQRELDEMTANSEMLRSMRDRLAALESLQATPVFLPLERERRELVHKMEQWLHVTRANKEAAGSELKRLQAANMADSAAHSVYRDTLFAPPMTTTLAHQVTPSTAAAVSALCAANDPAPRLARFFENLSTKEAEIKRQETALERIRKIERREEKLLTQLSQLEQDQMEPTNRGGPRVQHSGDAVSSALLPRYLGDNAPAVAAPSATTLSGSTKRVFRMDPNITARPQGASTALAGHLPLSPAPAAVPTQLFFSPRAHDVSGQHSPKGSGGGSNPFLSKAMADQHRSSMETTSNVTRRLEEYLKRR
jgi:hypothetical protein